MTDRPLPEGYQAVVPYLVAPDPGALMEFLGRALGAVEVERVPGEDGTVVHGEVRVGGSVVMIGAARPGTAPQPATLYHYTGDCDAAFRRAVEAGAEVIQEPADQFYGDRSAGVRDPAGNAWWIAHRNETLPPEELARRAAERPSS